MLKIVKDKPIINDVFDFDVVLFGMGINNSMNTGLKSEIALNFPEVLDSENLMPYGDKRKYGVVHCTQVNNIVFGACYIDKGKYNTEVSIDYEALRWCLKLVAKRFKKEKIITPILGVSKYDGNGDKEIILKIFEEECSDLDITIYDYHQSDFKEDIWYKIKRLSQDKKEKRITVEEYENKRNELEWIKNNGIFKPMPDNFCYKKKKVLNRQIISIKN